MIHPPGSAEQVAAFQNAQFHDAAYSSIMRVHEANMEKQREENRIKLCKCGSPLSDAERKYYGHNCERCEEKDHEAMEADVVKVDEKHEKEILLARNLERDLKEAVALTFCLRRLVSNLHPDVKKIINFGELLNERV